MICREFDEKPGLLIQVLVESLDAQPQDHHAEYRQRQPSPAKGR